MWLNSRQTWAHLSQFGRFHVNVGRCSQSRAEVGRSRADFGQSGQCQAKFEPNVSEFGPMLAEFGQSAPIPSHFWPSARTCWSKFVECGPNLVELSKSAQNRSTSALRRRHNKPVADGQNLTDAVANSAKLGEAGPSSTEFGQSLARDRSNSAHFGAKSAELGPKSGNFGPDSAEIGGSARPTCGWVSLTPALGRDPPTSSKHGQESSNFGPISGKFGAEVEPTKHSNITGKNTANRTDLETDALKLYVSRVGRQFQHKHGKSWSTLANARPRLANFGQCLTISTEIRRAVPKVGQQFTQATAHPASPACAHRAERARASFVREWWATKRQVGRIGCWACRRRAASKVERPHTRGAHRAAAMKASRNERAS